MSIMGIIEKTKKAREKKTRKRVLAGLAVGAVVGAAAGVLLAPKAGKETREDIANAARQLPEKAKEIADLSKAKFEEAKSKLLASKDAEAEAAACEAPEANE